MSALTELVLRHAVERPDQVALRDGAAELTYGELVHRARSLAARLRAAGVGPGDHVAMAVPRSVHSVAATVATWLAGAVHVPIDPAQPRARQRAILERARPRLSIGELPDAAGARWAADELRRAPPAAPAALTAQVTIDPQPEQPADEQIAYCMFTSGSTGLPKGVQISHRALTAFYEDIVAVHDVGPECRCLNTAPAFFDVTVLDTWFPLTRGASVRLTQPEDLFPPRFLALLQSARITHFCAVAPVLHLVAQFGTLLQRVALPELRCIMTGAESPQPPLMRAWLGAAPGVRILNGYGPTEATCVCTVHVIEQGDAAARYPIGRALARTQVVLVDEAGAPSDERGELWIGGPQLMSGYLGDPEETARRLGHLDGVPYYRSGDLCVREPDGALYYAGRVDAEVKLAGYRIHLAEVQRAAEQSGLVAGAFAALTPGEGGPRLTLAVVPSNTAAAAAPGALEAELVAAMRLHVPAYMIPARVVVLDRFPTLGSGKVDASHLRELLAASDR